MSQGMTWAGAHAAALRQQQDLQALLHAPCYCMQTDIEMPMPVWALAHALRSWRWEALAVMMAGTRGACSIRQQEDQGRRGA